MVVSFEKILNFPDKALMNKRLTKAFFLKNFLMTSQEKKFLNEHIRQMTILANLKPEKVNVLAYKNKHMVYEEIQVIICSLYANPLQKHSEKAIALIQKHIPYPIFLFVENEHDYIMNTCRKRINLNDSNKRTVEECFSTAPIPKIFKNDNISELFKSIDFAKLDKTNLKTLFDSYTAAIIDYQASLYTGNFKKKTPEFTEMASKYLNKIEQLEDEISVLTRQIKKESQINLQVQLNIQVQEKKAEIERLKNQL